MTHLMVHRGPDEEGYFGSRDVSLGLRRLRVIDLQTGSQPISNESNTIRVIANGEIYRSTQIRIHLEEKGHIFKSRSDIEVIVHLYEEYGLSFLEHIDGMFALALWDSERSRMVIARDRFGIKPLFYSVPTVHGGFAFGSEIRTILRLPGLNKELDPFGIDKFFALSYIPHPLTVYKHIKKLSPGHYLLVEQDSFKCICYWSLSSDITPSPTEDAIEAVDSAIASSVQAMMCADVEVGAFLSGGLDSGTVAYHMANHSTRPIKTFSVRFLETEFDEGVEANETAKILGAEHTEIWARPEDIKMVSGTQAHFGEPFSDSSQIPTFLVSQGARKQVTVALSGDGGDELFGGYLTYCASMLAERTQYVPNQIRRGLIRIIDKVPGSTGHAGLQYKLSKFLNGCHLPPVERHAMWKTIFTPCQRRLLYTEDFLTSLGEQLDSPVFAPWEGYFSNKESNQLINYQFLDITTYLTDNNLKKVDHMSMANSLEVRIPLLDLDVVKAAFNLHPNLRINGFKTKIALRLLMKGRLPESVIRMEKKGFSIPLSLWFLGPLRTYVYETLSAERLHAIPIVKPEAVKTIVDNHMNRRSNLSRQIWNLICFVHWYEGHVHA